MLHITCHALTRHGLAAYNVPPQWDLALEAIHTLHITCHALTRWDEWLADALTRWHLAATMQRGECWGFLSL